MKRGGYPVLAARVEVVVTHPGKNGSGIHHEKFELLDTGNGGLFNSSIHFTCFKNDIVFIFFTLYFLFEINKLM